MLNNVQGYLNSSGWNLDLSFEMRFGLEFEIAKFIKLKLGSIISSKIPLLGSAQEINFGIFASLGVEVESLFSATAEAQQQFGYNLSYDNWSLDATTMLLICSTHFFRFSAGIVQAKNTERMLLEFRNLGRHS